MGRRGGVLEGTNFERTVVGENVFRGLEVVVDGDQVDHVVVKKGEDSRVLLLIWAEMMKDEEVLND